MSGGMRWIGGGECEVVLLLTLGSGLVSPERWSGGVCAGVSWVQGCLVAMGREYCCAGGACAGCTVSLAAGVFEPGVASCCGAGAAALWCCAVGEGLAMVRKIFSR